MKKKWDKKKVSTAAKAFNKLVKKSELNFLSLTISEKCKTTTPKTEIAEIQILHVLVLK